MEKTIRYPVDAEEMTNAMMALSGWAGEKRKRAVIVLAVFLGFVGLCIALSFLSMGSGACALGPGYFIFSAVPLFLLYQVWQLPRRYRRMYADQKTLGSHSLTLADDFILFEGPFGQSRFPWPVFVRWKETGEYVFLYQNDKMANFIPKARLDAETLGFLRAKIRDHRIPEQAGGRTLAVRLAVALLLTAVFVLYLLASLLGVFSAQ